MFKHNCGRFALIGGAVLLLGGLASAQTPTLTNRYQTVTENWAKLREGS